MSKRGHHEGSLRRLPRKVETWEIAVTLPPDRASGVVKRATRTVRGTEDHARNELRKWLSDIYEGAHVTPDRQTIAHLAERWLADEKAPRVRPSTLHDYEDTIRTHLLPRLGTIRVQQLTVADVHQMLARMGREGVGVRTQQLTLLRLKGMLDWAVLMEMVRRNVAEPVPPPKSTTQEARAMSHAELRDFLRAARSDHYWPLWLVYATCGLRRGEGLGLRWSDADLIRKRVSVRQQVALVKGDEGITRPRIQELKTASARRTLDLDRETHAELTTFRRSQQELEHGVVYWEANDLIFCTRHGTPHNPNNLYRSFARICGDAGLDDDWTIHALRHTHASHLILAGVPITEVSRRLGHASVSITLSTYAHLVNDHQGRAVAAIEAALFPGLPELD